MNRIVVESIVDENGTLTLSIPIGKDEANRRVRVTIVHISVAETDEVARKARIRSLVGAWQGE